MVAYPPNINYNVAKEYLLTLKKKTLCIVLTYMWVVK